MARLNRGPVAGVRQGQTSPLLLPTVVSEVNFQGDRSSCGHFLKPQGAGLGSWRVSTVDSAPQGLGGRGDSVPTGEGECLWACGMSWVGIWGCVTEHVCWWGRGRSQRLQSI